MINELFLTFLLNALWQIALITGTAVCCAYFLGKSSARAQYFLWLAALLLSFLIPILTCLSLSDTSFFRVEMKQNNDTKNVFGSFPPSPTETSPKSNSMIAMSRNLSLILLALYLGCFGYNVFKIFKAGRWSQLIRRNAFAAEIPEHLTESVEQCQKFSKLKSLKILFSSSSAVPLTLGALDPVIILPRVFLTEQNRDLLLSAIGHEAVHIKRRDYLLNLFCEFIYLFISFHPAAALVKRRIKIARELSCDEQVAGKLMASDAYARALVEIAGSVINSRRQEAITIGINDADVLEERIMRIIKKNKISFRQNALVLIAAALLFSAAIGTTVLFNVKLVIAEEPSNPGVQEVIKSADRKVQDQNAEINVKSELKLAKLVTPGYPSAARAVAAQGEVVIKVTVDGEGKVSTAEVVSGHPLLKTASLEAARKTIFGKESFSKTGTLIFEFKLKTENVD